jgi:hypothetical protein
MRTGAALPEVKAAGVWSLPLSLSVANVKNEWGCDSPSPDTFKSAWRGKFTQNQQLLLMLLSSSVYFVIA